MARIWDPPGSRVLGQVAWRCNICHPKWSPRAMVFVVNRRFWLEDINIHLQERHGR